MSGWPKSSLKPHSYSLLLHEQHIGGCSYARTRMTRYRSDIAAPQRLGPHWVRTRATLRSRTDLLCEPLHAHACCRTARVLSSLGSRIGDQPFRISHVACETIVTSYIYGLAFALCPNLHYPFVLECFERIDVLRDPCSSVLPHIPKPQQILHW